MNFLKSQLDVIINFFSCYDGVTVDIPTYHRLPPTMVQQNTNIVINHSQPMKIPGSIDKYSNMSYTSSIVFSDDSVNRDDIGYMIWYTTIFLPVQEVANRTHVRA